MEKEIPPEQDRAWREMVELGQEIQGEVKEPDPQPELELRKEWTRLRAIMYEPSCVRLATNVADDGRWLTDEYVLLDVTDSPAVEGVEDGRYKLQAGKGLVPIDGANEFDPTAYFARLADAKWALAVPSEWSVAEHPGKAMLFCVQALDHLAVLLGESTWTTLRKHYPGAKAEYAIDGVNLNIFRILWGLESSSEALSISTVVVAYVAGIQVPEGQEGIAQAIAELVKV